MARRDRTARCDGTAAVTTHSAKLYGLPDDRVPGAHLANLDAAHHFIAIADE